MDEITTDVDFEIIKNNIDPIVHQSSRDRSGYQLFKDIYLQVKNGSSIAVQKNKFIILVVPETKWLAHVHLFSENKKYSPRDGYLLTKYIFTNYEYKKLYGKFSDERIANLAVKGGWKIEGRLTKAFVNGFEDNSELKDYVIAGACREDFVS